ncbi:hypothetical protein HanXRQr2_Chr07g0291431 [Helianthus annuus]|uniref:Uncharacterized protein n=1 Tax=Helianthus annuus TaxID=4232 RepID=A0A9K3IL21_HELAN|nr:hypothetical protein HanXRQr2_Chr07g0291431 [Helianthus annuus]KAJ0711058.1 hypothetical protein HanOQP8_Chr09g0319561 [Helianthus annuus]
MIGEWICCVLKAQRHKRASIEFVQEPSTIVTSAIEELLVAQGEPLVKIGKKKWNGSNHSNGWNRSMVGQSVPKRIQKLLHVHMDHSLSIWNIRLNFWEIVQLEMRLMMCWWMSRFQYKGNLILRKVKRLKLVMKRYVLQLGRLMNIVKGELFSLGLVSHLLSLLVIYLK